MSDQQCAFLAARADIRRMKRRLIRWYVGTTIITTALTASIAYAVAKLI